jgi:uncharacterized protein (DUF362 family)
MKDSLGEVYILKTTDRATGVPALLNKFDLKDYSGKQVALKANFNSADPFPASTHIDTPSKWIPSGRRRRRHYFS